MTINLRRTPGYVDRMREYEIVLDGKAVGKIKDGGEIQIAVHPGVHEIYLKLYWCRSNVVRFNYEGAKIKFVCGNCLTGWQVLLWFFYFVFLRNNYLWIRLIY